MTEVEWLAAAYPTLMLNFLEGQASDRKLRLLVAACCRRIFDLLPGDCQRLTETSERYADGLASRAEYAAALREVDPDLGVIHYDPPEGLWFAKGSVIVPDPPSAIRVSECLSCAVSLRSHAAAAGGPDATQAAARTETH